MVNGLSNKSMNNVQGEERLALLSPEVIRTSLRHLSRSDKVMAKLVASYRPLREEDFELSAFHVLASSIISQQVATAAAESIERRVFQLVKTFTPSGFLAVPIEGLRQAGLSERKSKYIIEAAKRVSDGRLNLESLHGLSDETVIATLTELPGIGRWTAQMFLIFALRRPDLLALGDVGLQNTVKILYGGNTQMEVLGEVWKPHRSVASWYLWRHSEAVKAAKKVKTVT